MAFNRDYRVLVRVHDVVGTSSAWSEHAGRLFYRTSQGFFPLVDLPLLGAGYTIRDQNWIGQISREEVIAANAVLGARETSQQWDVAYGPSMFPRDSVFVFDMSNVVARLVDGYVARPFNLSNKLRLVELKPRRARAPRFRSTVSVHLGLTHEPGQPSQQSVLTAEDGLVAYCEYNRAAERAACSLFADVTRDD